MNEINNVDFDELVTASRDLIRAEGHGGIVSIRQLLLELGGEFGDRFHVPLDVYEVLDLIEALWADPNIDQVPNTGWIEFTWNAPGFDQVSAGPDEYRAVGLADE